VLDADHVLLATGYRVDIARDPCLSADLVRDIARAGGYPKLGRGFESSVRGLYFVGAPAAWSFGPLFRFVAGTSWAAPRVAAALGAVRHTPARRRPEPEPETSTT
jgi:hypothetical protein